MTWKPSGSGSAPAAARKLSSSRQRTGAYGANLAGSCQRGHEWVADLTLICTSDGGIHTAFAVIDHRSRALMRLKVLTRKCCTWTVLSEFRAACAEHGSPAEVRTDNEGMFTGRLWVAFFQLAGIRR